jgi:hypothetical protein
MKRIALLIILIFNFSLVFANQVITYETFVHLPRNQQIQTIEMMWEFLINYDEYTLNDIKKREQYQVYKKILSSIISEAVAQEDNHQIKIHVDEVQCLWGGWFSIVNPSTGECTKPDQITKSSQFRKLKKDEPLRAEYFKKLEDDYKTSKFQNPQNRTGEYCKTNGSAGSKNFVCNPDFFGYDYSSGTKKPFCSVSLPSQNTSYLCFKAVDDLKNSNPEQYKKTMDGILAKLLSDKSNEKLAFSSMLAVMYDTCICAGNSKYINDRYSKRIFSDRTCYGLMMQSDHILNHVNNTNSCSLMSDIVFNDNISNMKEFGVKFSEQIKEQFHTANSKPWNFKVASTKQVEDEDFIKSRNQALQTNISQPFCVNNNPSRLVISVKETSEINKVFTPKLQLNGQDKEFKHAYYDWNFYHIDAVGETRLYQDNPKFKFEFAGNEKEKEKKNVMSVTLTAPQTDKEQIFKFKAEAIVKHDQSLKASIEVEFKLPPKKAENNGEVIIPDNDNNNNENDNDQNNKPTLSIDGKETEGGNYEISALLTPNEGFKPENITWSLDGKVNDTKGDKLTVTPSDIAQVVTASYKLNDNETIQSNSFTIPAKANSTAIDFKLTVDGEDDENDEEFYIVTASVTPDDEASLAGSVFTFEPNGELVDGQPNSRKYKKEKEAKNVKVKFTPASNIISTKKEYEDDIEVPAKEEKSFKISIEMESEDNNEGKFKALIDGKDEIPEGYSIQWFKIEKDSYLDADENDEFDDENDYSDEDEEEEVKEEDKSEKEEDEDTEEESEKGSESIKDQATESGTGLSVTIGKETEIYEVFAELVPNEDNENGLSQFSNRLELKEKVVPKQIHNTNPMQLPAGQAPQNFPMGPSILRGVF